LIGPVGIEDLRADGAHIGMRIQKRRQFREATRIQLRVVVQEHRVAASRLPQTQIVRSNVTDVAGLREELEIGDQLARNLQTAIGGSVIHQNDLDGGVSLGLYDAIEAFLQEIRRVHVDDHDAELNRLPGWVLHVVAFSSQHTAGPMLH